MPVQVAARVGLLYASSTGRTREAAAMVSVCLADMVSEPLQVSRLAPTELVACAADGGAVLLGAPTWATACQQMRTGTAMDDFLWAVRDSVPPGGLAGLRFAVFGCGDGRQFPDNFADGLDELHRTMAGLGAQPLGRWAPPPGEGYLHTASKAWCPAEGSFVGLPLDSVNQPELTPGRIHRWCEQLAAELGGDPRSVRPPPISDAIAPDPALALASRYPYTHRPAWCANGSHFSLFGTQMGARWYQFGDGDVAAGRWLKFTDHHILIRAGLRGQPEFQVPYDAITGMELRTAALTKATALLHLDPALCDGRPLFPHLVLPGLPEEDAPQLAAFLHHMGARIQPGAVLTSATTTMC